MGSRSPFLPQPFCDAVTLSVTQLLLKLLLCCAGKAACSYHTLLVSTLGKLWCILGVKAMTSWPSITSPRSAMGVFSLPLYFLVFWIFPPASLNARFVSEPGNQHGYWCGTNPRIQSPLRCTSSLCPHGKLWALFFFQRVRISLHKDL